MLNDRRERADHERRHESRVIGNPQARRGAVGQFLIEEVHLQRQKIAPVENPINSPFLEIDRFIAKVGIVAAGDRYPNTLGARKSQVQFEILDASQRLTQAEVLLASGEVVKAERAFKEIVSRFRVVHGGPDSGGHVHSEDFRVVGILKETETANDRTVFINLNGFYAIQGHETVLEEAVKRERDFFGAGVPVVSNPAGNDGLYLAQKDVTAIFVNTTGGVAGPILAAEINKGYRAQAVKPVQVMQGYDQFLRGVRSKTPKEKEESKKGFLFGLGWIESLLISAMSSLTAICAVPLWIISKKVGFNNWSRIAASLPVSNVILPGFLAFRDWP